MLIKGLKFQIDKLIDKKKRDEIKHQHFRVNCNIYQTLGILWFISIKIKTLNFEIWLMEPLRLQTLKALKTEKYWTILKIKSRKAS